MFKIKLTALGHPFPNTVNAEDPQDFRKCIHWLEDLKIRHYPIESRAGLRKVDSPVEWYVAYKSYKIDLAVSYLTTTVDELNWFLDKAILLEYEDIENFPKFPILNINIYDKDFMECIKQLSKELKLNEYNDEEYCIQIKDISLRLKYMKNPGHVTGDQFLKVENQARILKLLELQGIKKTLNEKIKKETLEEIKNDLVNAPEKLDEPKVIETAVTVPKITVPTICIPPPTLTESKIEEPGSDADCFIVEDKSDTPQIILKAIQPEAEVKLDLRPLIQNILQKLTAVQLKKVCKDSRYKNRKKTRNFEAASVIIDGVIALPETVTPIKSSVFVNKPVLAKNFCLKPVVRSLQNQFPKKNGSRPQRNPQMKIEPVSKPNTSNANSTMKRVSTPVPIEMIDKKQKVDDAQQKSNPLKVFIYNESISGGKITVPQSLILAQKLLQIIDEDTSKNGHLIRFDHSKLDNGIYTIICANEFAKDWLQGKMNLLNNLWPLAALRLTETKLKISKFTRLSVFIPGSNDETAPIILNRIKRQNPLLDTEKWEIIGHYPKKKSGVQLVVGMDEESFNAIQLIDLRPYYGLTRITFREKFSLN